MQILVARFRKLREEQGLTLTDVAELAGMTRASISHLENGSNINPRLESLFNYASAFGGWVSLSFTSLDDEPMQRGH